VTVYVTPQGQKAWPLAGTNAYSGVEVVEDRTIDLVGTLGATAYETLYRTQPWVYTVVNKIAKALARLPLKAYELDEASGSRQRLREHPLASLLRTPWPGGSQYSMVEFVMIQKLVHGNALLVQEQSQQMGAPPVALWPVDWAQVKILRGKTTPIAGYRVETGAVRKTWLPDEVLHFRAASIDGIAGISPLQPLARTLTLEDAAQRASISSFRNGMRPATAYVVPGRLQPQQRSELEAKLRQQNTGVDTRGGNMLLEGGADLKSVTHTAQEAELVMSRKLNREEVAATYNVDPTQIGILDRATFSNVEEAHRGFYMDTLGPEATQVEDVFSTQLISRFFDFEGTFVEFDMADVLKGNLESRFLAYSQSLVAGWITRNEVRAFENLPPVNDRGADALYAPLNMVALDGRIPSNESTPVGTPPLAG